MLYIALLGAVALVAIFMVRKRRAPDAHDLPDGWSLGPVVNGVNKSAGVVMERQGDVFAFDFPQTGEVSAAILYVDGLAHADRITARFEISGDGAFHPADNQEATATISLMFQRRGDNWGAQGKYEFYRWYAPDVMALAVGTHEISADIDDPNWLSVFGKKASDHPEEFDAALLEAGNIAIVFGGGGGRAHGVSARGDMRFELIDCSY